MIGRGLTIEIGDACGIADGVIAGVFADGVRAGGEQGARTLL